MSQCKFTDYDVQAKLSQKRKLGTFINQLIFQFRKNENYVSYTFVSDSFLLEMNQSHLNHDTYTDIITFDLTEPNSKHILVDIYISVDRVRENATLNNTTFQNELLRVILHGALHIAGFGDKSKKKKEIMRQMENEWMQKYLTFQ